MQSDGVGIGNWPDVASLRGPNVHADRVTDCDADCDADRDADRDADCDADGYADRGAHVR